MTVRLKKFDMRMVKDDATVLFLGKRRVGKSVMLRDLLYYHQDMPVGTIFSGSEGSNSFYSTMVPPIFIYEEFDEAALTRVVLRQDSVVKATNKEIAQYGYTNIDPRCFIVIDDCLHDQNLINRNRDIRQLFFNGRHKKVLLLITSQGTKGLPPNFRNNLDYIFIFRQGIRAELKKIHECFAGIVGDFNIFCQILEQCTENYGCMVIDNTSISSKMEDCVYWYKASQHTPFQLCLREYWDYSRLHLKTDDSDEVADNILNTKRRTQQITLKRLGE